MRLEIEKKDCMDKEQLPYCNAVIMETLRYIPLIGLGAPRETWEDLDVDGFKIPTGMIIKIKTFIYPGTKNNAGSAVWGSNF